MGRSASSRRRQSTTQPAGMVVSPCQIRRLRSEESPMARQTHWIAFEPYLPSSFHQISRQMFGCFGAVIWVKLRGLTLDDVFRRYSFKRALIIFVLAQILGTGLALGVAAMAPGFAAIPGTGVELLRGMPALLIILSVWLELMARSIRPTQDLSQIFQRISRVDLAAIVGFNLALGILSILVILLGIQLVSPGSLSEILAPAPSSLTALLVAAVTSTTLAPVSEEIVFRGWLFNALRRRLQTWPAILLSSLAFAAIHPSLSSITTFVFGLFVAIAYFKTQNLWVSILIHALNNLLISVQSIAEHLLIRTGLVNDSANLAHLALILGIPSVLVVVLLGHYLVAQQRYFNLLVPLSA